MWGYYGNGFSLFGGIIMVFFWVLIATGLVMFIRYLASGGCQHEIGAKAIDILKERYAKGEITKKEFEAMKKDIG